MPHIHDKIDFTSEVFIIHENKVLLRKHDKYKIWLSVGGHIELHEDPNQAALREVLEEVGLNVELINHQPTPIKNTEVYYELTPPRFLNRHRINANHEHVTLVYFARATGNKVIPEKENDEWKWFTTEELDDPQYGIKNDIIFYAKNALKELKEK